MTDQQHPITPPPELIRKWNEEAATAPMADQRYIATQAARWGADAELEACCQTLYKRYDIPTCIPPKFAEEMRDWLRAARRPNPPRPPSLAEEALAELERMVLLFMPVTGPNKVKRLKTIRRALERLQELENNG